MKIKLVTHWSDYPPGAEIELHDDLAARLVAAGMARVVGLASASQSHAPAIESMSLATPEAAILPRARERKRVRNVLA